VKKTKKRNENSDFSSSSSEENEEEETKEEIIATYMRIQGNANKGKIANKNGSISNDSINIKKQKGVKRVSY